jgi:glycosyltransferase involved in cell wall biosynthesis
LISLLYSYRRVARELREVAKDFRPDIYYERECPFDPILWRAVRHLGLPSIVEINVLVTEELRLHGASWRGILLASVLQRMKCRAATVLVCGASGWVDWLERTYRLPKGRAVFVPNGVVTEPFLAADRASARDRIGFGCEDFVVGFFGAFNQYADLRTVILGIHQAHRTEPRVKGYLVGGGRLLPECEMLVRDLDADGVIRFGGQIPHHEVPMHMAALDCGVAPMTREWLEQMRCWHASTKVAEYLASGLPLLAFDLPGSDSDVVMSEVALTKPPGDVYGFADTILTLLSSPQRRQRMSERARTMALNERSWMHTVQQVIHSLEHNIR